MLYGECSDYGVDKKLSFCPIELASRRSNLVEWKWFALEKTKSRSGRPLKKIDPCLQENHLRWNDRLFEAKAPLFCET